MNLNINFLESIRDDILDLSIRVLNGLGDSGAELQQRDKKEIVTRADETIENAVIDYIKQNEIKANLDGEEKRRTKITDHPEGLIVLDPLDGTYRFWRRFLPYSTIVTIFDSPEPKTIGEAAVTGIVEHTTGRIWKTSRGKPVFLYEPELKREFTVKTSGITSLDGNVSGFVDHGPCSKPEDFLRFINLYQKSWVTNISSAGVHLASISSGNYAGSDFFVSWAQKPEEVVAGLLLIENANGTIIDFQGNPIRYKPYDFNARYEVIAASTQELAEEVRKNILRKPTLQQLDDIEERLRYYL